MIRLNDKIFTCPVDVALHFISGKWKILILNFLYKGTPRRYFEIKNNLPGVSEKVLFQQLNQLERDGLISKSVLTKKPLTVEYSLTEKGTTFSPLIDFLSGWGMDFLKKNGIAYIKDQHIFDKVS